MPERAQVARVILMELQRIASHLVFMGTGVLDFGAIAPIFWAFELRDRILDIFEQTTGQRMNPIHPRRRPGQDMPHELQGMVEDFLKFARQPHPGARGPDASTTRSSRDRASNGMTHT